MAIDPTRNVLSVSQAAELLKVTPRMVRFAIERKQIKARWLGTSYVLDRAEVKRYSHERRSPGRPRRVPRRRTPVR